MYKAKILLVFLPLLAAACTKGEGTGGTASIQGRVYKVMHYDDCSLTVDTFPAAKEDVFIVYGDDPAFGDDVETGEDGFFRFRYLNPGTYTVYAYSEYANGCREAVKRTVSLKRSCTATPDDIYIHDGKAYGTSVVRGRVWADYFDKNGDNVRSNWAYEQRVYIRNLAEDCHSDDARVGNDGCFFFQKLSPGRYEVYTFSQYLDETPYPVRDTVEVVSPNTIVETDTLRVRLKA